VLISVLAGGFANLMIDIRVEHVEVVRERPVAWVPIIYSGLMVVACGCAFVIWNQTMRRVMVGLFLLAFVVGGLGFYFHSHGDFGKVLHSSIQAWTDPAMNHSDGPPELAPLAFAGLGVIGLLISLRRFNS
jgi:hypothetical protein